MSDEVVKRLTPVGDVLRELHLKSGNICAFPECSHLLINAEGVFVAQLCHIEAAEEGGQRFNKLSSNEERRTFKNLMLMCHEHHKITNDVEKFPVEKLRTMKLDHERRFSDPVRAITLSLKDWTVSGRTVEVKNLERMAVVLGWADEREERAFLVNEVNRLIKRLEVTPHDVRSFVSQFIQRARRLKISGAVKWGGSIAVAIVSTDLESAFDLSQERINHLARQLEEYGLGGSDDLVFGHTEKYAVYLHGLEGLNFWASLAQFCEKEVVGLDAFLCDLCFERLDSVS